MNSEREKKEALTWYSVRLSLLILFCSISLSSLTQSLYPRVQVDTLIDFSEEDSISLAKELFILQQILYSPKFWSEIRSTQFYCADQRILHSKRKGSGTYPKLKKDKHLYSSIEIHDMLMHGDDEIGEPKDGVINLKLRSKIFKPNKNGSTTHGSTNKNTLIISSSPETRINSKVKGQYACHIIHEYMHILGFKHKNNLPSKNKEKCGGVDVPLRIQKIAASIVTGLGK